jgi:2'-5' RNA ligase
MFVAVPVPDSVKQHARMLRNELGISRADIKWVEYKNYHLTLKFLGEVQEGFLPAISASLRQAAEYCPAFNLAAGDLGFFPDRHKPRVIWMGIKGELDKAVYLGGRVDAYLSSLGFEEEKEHRFHLTLGRIRSDVQNHELLKVTEEIAGKDKLTTFKVEQFQLMQSSLTQSGPVYTTLETFTLKG